MLALSVSTSAITSPIATRSPGRLSHLRILPSSIVSESFGIVTSTGIGGPGWENLAPLRRDRRTRRLGLAAEHAPHGGDDPIRRWQDEVLEVSRVGHRHVEVRHAFGGRVELVEGPRHDARDQLRGEARERPAFLDDDAAVRLPDGS